MGVPSLHLHFTRRFQLFSHATPHILALDFNAIIHNCIRYKATETTILANIEKYIDGIMRSVDIAELKVLYISVDGVAPRAKLNQQRQRRYRAAYEASLKAKTENVDLASLGVNNGFKRNVVSVSSGDFKNGEMSVDFIKKMCGVGSNVREDYECELKKMESNVISDDFENDDLTINDNLRNDDNLNDNDFKNNNYKNAVMKNDNNYNNEDEDENNIITDSSFNSIETNNNDFDLEDLPSSESKILESYTLFDSNAITPGTDFMEKLDQHMHALIKKKMAGEYKQLIVIYSSSKVPGEGEQKIMTFLRGIKSSDFEFRKGFKVDSKKEVKVNSQFYESEYRKRGCEEQSGKRCRRYGGGMGVVFKGELKFEFDEKLWDGIFKDKVIENEENDNFENFDNSYKTSSKIQTVTNNEDNYVEKGLLLNEEENYNKDSENLSSYIENCFTEHYENKKYLDNFSTNKDKISIDNKINKLSNNINLNSTLLKANLSNKVNNNNNSIKHENIKKSTKNNNINITNNNDPVIKRHKVMSYHEIDNKNRPSNIKNFNYSDRSKPSPYKSTAYYKKQTLTDETQKTNLDLSLQLPPITNVAIFSPDADLYFLALTLPFNVHLIREDLNFKKSCTLCNKKGHTYSECLDITLVKFSAISIALLKANLLQDITHNFKNITFDNTRLINDFIFVCCFCGNDFIPSLPCLDVRFDAIGAVTRLLNLFYKRRKKYITTMNKFTTKSLNMNEVVNLDGLAYFLEILCEKEAELYKRKAWKLNEAKEKFGGLCEDARLDTEEGKRKYYKERLFGDMFGGGVGFVCNDVFDNGKGCKDVKESIYENFNENRNDNQIVNDYNRHENNKTKETENARNDVIEINHSNDINVDAYNNVSNTKTTGQLTDSMKDLIDNAVKKLIEVNKNKDNNKNKNTMPIFDNNDLDLKPHKQKCATDYLTTVCWTFLLYTQGIFSWTWYYPYHYSPLAEDLLSVFKLKTLEVGKPLSPLTQLLVVLPPQCAYLAPAEYSHLFEDVNLFPTSFKMDQFDKLMEWQSLVLLPFIDVNTILEFKQNQILNFDAVYKDLVGVDYLYVGFKGNFYKKLKDVNEDGNRKVKKCELGLISGCWDGEIGIENGMCESVRFMNYEG